MLRAQGIAMEDLQKSKFANFHELLEGDREEYLEAGNLVAFLVQSETAICLAILEVSGFRFGKEKNPRPAAKRVDLATGRPFLSGQNDTCALTLSLKMNV